MSINADDLDVEHTGKLPIATIVPRPIGWVSSLSPDGVANLAPISFFTWWAASLRCCRSPCSIGQTGGLEDSFINIRDTGEFVTNLVTLGNASAMHKTAMELAPEVDEFEKAGLEKAPCEVVQPPRVAMECKLERYFTVGDYEDHVMWGRVAHFHIRDDLYLGRGRVDTGAVAPVGRLAAEYTLVNNAFTKPLDQETLDAWSERRMERLDGKPSDFSAVAQKNWSASGSVIDD